MKRYLLKKVRLFFSSALIKIIRSISDIRNLTKESVAYQKLCSELRINHYLPTTNWSIPPTLILHALNDIRLNDKRMLIEFGSGFSTICIANFIKAEKREIQFYSIESDEKWYSIMMEDLKKMDLESYVQLILAPLGNQKELDNALWYDLAVLDSALKNSNSFDLIIVDGPIGGLSKNSRLPAIPYLKHKVSKNIKVFLDDTNRPDEKYILQNWNKILMGRVESYDRYSVITKGEVFGTVPYVHG